MREFFLKYGNFGAAIMLFCLGIAFSSTSFVTGVEIYLMGLVSMCLLLVTARQARYPFATDKKIQSRIALAIWSLVLGGGLIVGGSSLMANYFGHDWLKLLFFVFLLFGVPLAKLYPNGWRG
jgi:hypothetical protein